MKLLTLYNTDNGQNLILVPNNKDIYDYLMELKQKSNDIKDFEPPLTVSIMNLQKHKKIMK